MSRYRTVIRAIRFGLAENVRLSNNFLSRDNVLFDLPGGLTVEVCCNRQSLQTYDSVTYHRVSIGGSRRCCRVLAELKAQGWVDPYATSPWEHLAETLGKSR